MQAVFIVFSIYFTASKGECDAYVSKISLLYCAAFLTKYRRNVSIPVEWVQGLTCESVYNHGMDVEKSYTVFYAPENSVQSSMGPDFSTAHISNAATFDEGSTFGYFVARIGESFSKQYLSYLSGCADSKLSIFLILIHFLAYKGDCVAYVSKKRNIIPKYYGQPTKKFKKPAIIACIDTEFDSGSAIKLESSLDARQRQLTVLRKSYEKSVIDITPTNLRLIQDVLDEEERELENADPPIEVTDQASASVPVSIKVDSVWDSPFLEDVSKLPIDFSL